MEKMIEKARDRKIQINKLVKNDTMEVGDQIRCHNCKEVGHIKSKCPRIKCHKCGKNGHYARDCTNKTTFDQNAHA